MPNNRTVLLVDPDQRSRRKIMTILEQIGYDAICADSSPNALFLLASRSAFGAREKQFACVVIERDMPNMPAVNMVDEMRAPGLLSRVPVLIIADQLTSSDITAATLLKRCNVVARSAEDEVFRRMFMQLVA